MTSWPRGYDWGRWLEEFAGRLNSRLTRCPEDETS
jgi:hypothetical protein